jgi:DNA-binding protein Fis
VPADPDGIWLPSLDTVQAEELLIQAALQRAEGNRTRAAQLLNMSVRTLRHKLNVSGKEE